MVVEDLLPRVTAALADRYRVERELGHGSMASVFLAQDLPTGQPVAIKVLHPSFAASIGPERFQREIRFVASLDHPNILPIFDCALRGPILYYVMRYAASGSLRDRLDHGGPMPTAEALSIVREVAGAIDFAHSRNIVHRDIKPGNILFDRGRAMVCDFGVARALVANDEVSISSSGIVLGTPAYASPEQARGSKEVDGRTDIYALGCVLYEMLAGEPVFTGTTPQAILARHLNDRPRSIRVIRPEVPEPVEVAILAALAKKPEDRPQSGAELVRKFSGGQADVRMTTN